jgi:hypothetical protein
MDNPHLKELLEKIQNIASKGWVKSMRSGDTGIGYTLETLLGISANSNRAPDFKGIEIKSHRLGKSGRITLFSKTPDWNNYSRVQLLDEHGSLDKNDRWSIYTSIYGNHESTSGWKLEHYENEERLYVMRHGVKVVFWPISVIREALQNKHRKSLFVFAERRGSKETEEFKYVRATYAENSSYDKLTELILSGKVCHDFAMHRREDGSVKDHGFLFRINAENVTDIFESRKEFSFAGTTQLSF